MAFTKASMSTSNIPQAQLDFNQLVHRLDPNPDIFSSPWKTACDRRAKVVLIYQLDVHASVPCIKKAVRIDCNANRYSSRNGSAEDGPAPTVFVYNQALRSDYVYSVLGRRTLESFEQLAVLLEEVSVENRYDQLQSSCSRDSLPNFDRAEVNTGLPVADVDDHSFAPNLQNAFPLIGSADNSTAEQADTICDDEETVDNRSSPVSCEADDEVINEPICTPHRHRGPQICTTRNTLSRNQTSVPASRRAHSARKSRCASDVSFVPAPLVNEDMCAMMESMKSVSAQIERMGQELKAVKKRKEQPPQMDTEEGNIRWSLVMKGFEKRKKWTAFHTDAAYRLFQHSEVQDKVASWPQNLQGKRRLLEDKTMEYVDNYWLKQDGTRTRPSLSHVRKAFNDWKSHQKKAGRRRTISESGKEEDGSEDDEEKNVGADEAGENA